jgi:hypothetical protein
MVISLEAIPFVFGKLFMDFTLIRGDFFKIPFGMALELETTVQIFMRKILL